MPGLRPPRSARQAGSVFSVIHGPPAVFVVHGGLLQLIVVRLDDVEEDHMDVVEAEALGVAQASAGLAVSLAHLPGSWTGVTSTTTADVSWPSAASAVQPIPPPQADGSLASGPAISLLRLQQRRHALADEVDRLHRPEHHLEARDADSADEPSFCWRRV